jgi:hypothetical protein
MAPRLKGVLVMVATAGFVVGFVYLLNVSEQRQSSGPGTESGAAPGQVPVAPAVPEHESLRDQLLRSSAQQAGVTPARGVWGVVMDRAYAKGVATLVALADGTASLHISSGGTGVSGKSYAPARAAAVKLCETAADSLRETIAVQEFPAPAKGRVRYYVLTVDGVRLAEGDLLPGRDGGRDALAPLAAAGDAVLAALREATDKGLIR